MRVALDTSFLVYAEDINDRHRRDVARDIVCRLPRNETFLPVQVLGELFHVLTRKAKRRAEDAREAVLGWRDAFAPADTSYAALLSAMDLVVAHKLRIWDAVILATAAEANCRLLLSKDMQDGFTWRGVTVVDPFAASTHPMLDAVLSDASPE
ncbi:MAG: PIN domain-containing protein [Gammaproteobacteria bacterium]|nr:MAG: PIN domain-containing protein [Gammaproteobacteria bacterium]